MTTTSRSTYRGDNSFKGLLKRLERNMRNPAQCSVVPMTEKEVLQLCNAARDSFLQQSSLLELEPPVIVCGDVHGQYSDLLRIFNKVGHPRSHVYLFLGDYVDRGRYNLETICLLLCYKVQFPSLMYMLRGNHECSAINKIYGFFHECTRRLTIRVWKRFQDVFNAMPLAALVGRKILCMHGGISPDLRSLNQLREIERPLEAVTENALVCDLLWSDPDKNIAGFDVNRGRGVAYVFGPDAVKAVCARLDIDIVVRAHQVVEDGFEFFADRHLVTLFSAPNYCGTFDNCAAAMLVNHDLIVSFIIIKPRLNAAQVRAIADPEDSVPIYETAILPRTTKKPRANRRPARLPARSPTRVSGRSYR